MSTEQRAPDGEVHFQTYMLAQISSSDAGRNHAKFSNVKLKPGRTGNADMHRLKILSLTWLLAMVLACGSCGDVFEYSPNQIFDGDTETGLNARNLDSLYAAPADDTITIAFVGDSQRFYDELSNFIDTVNSMAAVDFILLAGDITDFGLLEEFELIEDMLSDLNRPYLGVIGNHDVLAKGEETFERMFGPLDFSFVYGDVKFIVHNTNGREYGPGQVPNLEWLSAELSETDGAKHVVAVSHIPPFDGDFDPALAEPYANLLQKHQVLVSLHGHIHAHKDGYPYGDGIRYITSHSFDQRSFVLLKIVKGNVISQIVDY